MVEEDTSWTTNEFPVGEVRCLSVRMSDAVEVAATVRTEERKLVEVAKVVVPIPKAELALSMAKREAEERAVGEE